MSASLIDTKQCNCLLAKKFGTIKFLKSCYSQPDEQSDSANSSKQPLDDGDIGDTEGPKKHRWADSDSELSMLC